MQAASDRTAHALLPATAPVGVYAVVVANDAHTTPVAFVNRARASSFEFGEVAPGTWFRVWGRNLALPGGTREPAVRFRDPATGASLAGAVALARSDAYALWVRAPAGLVAGTAYEVYVSNGYGSAVATRPAPRAGGHTDLTFSRLRAWKPSVSFSASPLPAGSYSYVAVTYDGSTAAIYVDGVGRDQQANFPTVTGSGAAATPGESLVVTSSHPVYNRADLVFRGSIDEPAVCDRALPAEAIAAHYAAASAGR